MGFQVILIRDNGPEILPEGNATSILSTSPNIQSAFLTGKCTECGRISLMEGFPHETERNMRSMGRESLWTSEHYSDCECGEEMFANVEYMEYPRGTFQPYELRPRENMEYAKVDGISHLINNIPSTRKSYEEDPHQQLRELQEAVQDGAISGDDDTLNQMSGALDNLISKIDNSIVVLGSYDDEDKEELRDVQSSLQNHGYDANLVEDLPCFQQKSLPQNVSIAMSTSRFCIMVDRGDSGSNNEYEIARYQRLLMARLVPQGEESSYMMGGEEEVSINHINSFQFEDSPEEVIDAAIEWAEERLTEREDVFTDVYPWRTESTELN